MKTLAIVLLALTIGCGLRTKETFMAGMTQEETKQTPQFGMLPNDAGIFVGYQFKTRDLTETEDFRMLAAVIRQIERLNGDPTTEFSFNFEGKVVIFAYEGKTLSVTATADFGNEEVELWSKPNDKDWYVKKTYKGDPGDVLEYLTDGVEGSPKVEEGKASEEPKVSFGKKADCRATGTVRYAMEKEW
jgi:hypothetical protein